MVCYNERTIDMAISKIASHDTARRFNRCRLRRKGFCRVQNLILRHRERNHATILSKWRLLSQAGVRLEIQASVSQFAASIYVSLRSARLSTTADI